MTAEEHRLLDEYARATGLKKGDLIHLAMQNDWIIREEGGEHPADHTPLPEIGTLTVVGQEPYPDGLPFDEDIPQDSAPPPVSEPVRVDTSSVYPTVEADEYSTGLVPGWADRIYVSTPRPVALLISRVKGIGARWDGDLQAWTLPLDAAPDLRAIIKQVFG